MKDEQEPRWRSRPIIGAILKMAVFVVPLGCAVLAAAVAVRLLPKPDTNAALLVWWLLVIGSTLTALYVFDRLARRLLPLAALMKLTMVFPDHAPSRMELARKAGRTRDLKSRSAVLDDAEGGIAQQTAEQILTLLSALTKHDRGTRGHSERVRVLVDMISEELKLNQHERDRLRWAALLHDVGKLAVPNELLNKKGAPSRAEWELIRTHPSEGLRMVAPLQTFLGEWAGAIEHHHEKWDGTGYSLGLAGEEISLGGRIVAVADAYEVITGYRPYKKPLGIKAAREELAHQAGTHFDPHIVRALFNISLGRLWRSVGLSSWVASLPFLPPWMMPRLQKTVRNFGAAAAGVATAIALGGGLIAGQTFVPKPVQERGPLASAEAPVQPGLPTEVLGIRLERLLVPQTATPMVPTLKSSALALTQQSLPIIQPTYVMPQPVTNLMPQPTTRPTHAPPLLPSRVSERIRRSHGACVSEAAHTPGIQKGRQVRLAASDGCA